MVDGHEQPHATTAHDILLARRVPLCSQPQGMGLGAVDRYVQLSKPSVLLCCPSVYCSSA